MARAHPAMTPGMSSGGPARGRRDVVLATLTLVQGASLGAIGLYQLIALLPDARGYEVGLGWAFALLFVGLGLPPMVFSAVLRQGRARAQLFGLELGYAIFLPIVFFVFAMGGATPFSVALGIAAAAAVCCVMLTVSTVKPPRAGGPHEEIRTADQHLLAR
jgi:hypothetical protein